MTAPPPAGPQVLVPKLSERRFQQQVVALARACGWLRSTYANQ